VEKSRQPVGWAGGSPRFSHAFAVPETGIARPFGVGRRREFPSFTPNPRSATIVVCEDDDATLDLLCDHLTADRFEVLTAPSAVDALRLCRYNHPDDRDTCLSAKG
jgi:hypothetical protein